MTNPALPSPASLEHPRLREFARKIGGKGNPMRIPAIQGGRPTGVCYWNVEATVHERGGSAIYGWLFEEARNLYLKAVHHAVWKAPDGKVWDVTVPYTRPNDHTIFVASDRFQIDLDRMPAITNEYEILRLNEHVQELVNADRELVDLNRRIGANLFDAGDRCTNQRRRACRMHELNLPFASPEQYQELMDLIADQKRENDRVFEAWQRCASLP